VTVALVQLEGQGGHPRIRERDEPPTAAQPAAPPAGSMQQRSVIAVYARIQTAANSV